MARNRIQLVLERLEVESIQESGKHLTSEIKGNVVERRP